MSLSTVYLIRHAEKPEKKANVHLSVQGAMRAAALSVLFNHGRSGAYLPLDALYATAVSAHSRREVETLEPLHAALPNVNLNASFANGEEIALVAAMKAAANSIVLVAWHHERIREIAMELGVVDCPKWHDDDTYDRVWTIELGSGVPKLSDTPQRLLFGDAPV